LSCLFLMTASRMRACARDAASRLCVRTVLCSSAFSWPRPFAPRLRNGRGRFVRSLPRYFGQVRLLSIALIVDTASGLPDNVPATTGGTAMEISRFPCKRLLRMPGSTTTRGRHVSRDIDTGHVAFCVGRKTSAPRTCLTPLNTSPARAESARGLAPRAAHRTVRDTLASSGSCHY